MTCDSRTSCTPMDLAKARAEHSQSFSSRATSAPSMIRTRRVGKAQHSVKKHRASAFAAVAECATGTDWGALPPSPRPRSVPLDHPVVLDRAASVLPTNRGPKF
jgi:hypothetical protein